MRGHRHTHTHGGRKEGEGGRGRESDKLHKEAVRLYKRWAVEGHIEERPREGLRADEYQLNHGRQAHDVAVEALATRVRRGEKIVLMCHCAPQPCHGRVVTELINAAVERGRWTAEHQGEQDIFQKWLAARYDEG